MGRFKLVEKKNHLAVHAHFYTREAGLLHLKHKVPQYVARGYFMDKSLTASDFEIIGPDTKA